MLLNNERVKNEIRGEIKKFLETNKNELTTTKIYGTQQRHSEREVYSDTGLP